MKGADKTSSKLQKLTELLTGKAYLLVVMQDSPDPDSLAAAVALRRLAKSLANLQCSIAYGGTVGRGENRALVKYLGLNLRSCDEIDYDKFDVIAMVDTQPATGNNSLPDRFCPTSSLTTTRFAVRPAWSRSPMSAATTAPPRRFWWNT